MYKQVAIWTLMLAWLPLPGHAQAIQTVCMGSVIPAGWVIIHVSTDFSKCGGVNNNVYTIEQISTLGPGQVVSACTGNVLPVGWVTQNIGTNFADCGGSVDNIYMLLNLNGEPAAATASVCAGGTIPPGWVLRDVATDFTRCLSSNNNLSVLLNLNGVGLNTPESICAGDLLPSGWIVTSVTTDITRCNGVGTSNNIEIATLAGDFSLSASPAKQIVTKGDTTSFNVVIARSGGFTGAVSLSTTGLPNDANPTFSPNPATGGSSTLTITGSATISTFGVTIHGLNGNANRTTGVNLQVTDYSLSVCSPTLVVAPGVTINCLITVNAMNGFSQAVFLSADGANASFIPNPTTNSSTMTIKNGTALGTSVVTINGQEVGGSAVRYKPVTLISSTTLVASRYVPVTPCRIADTRGPTGPFGGPFLAGGTTREFDLPSACGIPSTPVAYALNATVVPRGPLGYLTMLPCGQSQPLTSNLNSIDGRVKAVAAIIPAGTNGAVCAFASNDTDLVLDINGYFVPATDPTGLAFYPVTPCRLVDTRLATGSLGGPYLAGSTTRTFPILSSSCNVPGTAQAYSLNYTAVPRGPLGYLTTWPAGQPQPLVSTLNAPTGTVAANAAIVTAGSNGDVSVFVSNDSDLVIDINGYFAPPVPGGLSLFPLTPCRFLDTRNPAGSPLELDPQGPAQSSPFIGTLAVNVTASGCGTPASAQAYVLNATVIPSGPLGYITLWPNGTPQPLVSTLNANDGAVTSNMAIVPATNGSVNVYASNLTQLVLDIFGYFAP